MARVLSYPEIHEWKRYTIRPSSGAVEEGVIKKIFKDIEQKGDAAIKKHTARFDKVILKNIAIAIPSLKTLEKHIPKELTKSIRLAYENIRYFHEQSFAVRFPVLKYKGLRAWKKRVPLQSVGLYVPGGRAPLFSTALMLGIPAQIAGCPEVVMCTPPGPDGKVSPSILYAARLCGIKKLFACGGVQAIAGMACGTESIPSVDKIFGPGNAWVTAAKQYAFLYCKTAIDMPAGPSEVLIIADDSACPGFVAADLLSQCEHGPDSQAVLLTPSSGLIKKVQREADRMLRTFPAENPIHISWKNSLLVVLKNLDECVSLSNAYAPEHLILQTQKNKSLFNKILHAGSVFIGNYSTEPMGDYISGPNHTLPTSGLARSWSGLSVDHYIKTISFQELSEKSLRRLGPSAIVMARAEKLHAHAYAVEKRLKKIYGTE